MSDISDEILDAAIKAKAAALSIETKFADSRSNGPAPADFGEHEEIPEEAVTAIPVVATEKSVDEKD